MAGSSQTKTKSASKTPPKKDAGPVNSKARARRSSTPSLAEPHEPLDLVISPTALEQARLRPRTYTALASGRAPSGANDQPNLCYRNSVLNMLLASDRFIATLANRYRVRHALAVEQQSDSIKAETRNPLTSPFSGLLELSRIYWGTEAYSKDITEGVNTFWEYMRRIGRPKSWEKEHGHQEKNPQCDAWQFLLWLLNAEEPSIFKRLQGPDGNKTVLYNPAWDEWANLSTMMTNESRVCRTCQKRFPRAKKGQRDEHRPGPMIPLPNSDPGVPIGLAVLLQDFFKAKVQNTWRCNRCQEEYETWKECGSPIFKRSRKSPGDAPTTGNSWKAIAHLPELLFMCLKRWDVFDPSDTSSAFIHDAKILLPREIDFAPWMDKNLVAISGEPLHTRYQLQSVVSHSGDEDGGHYINFSCVDGQWYEIDGRAVQPVDFDDVQDGQGFLSYMLLWERIISDDTERSDGENEEVREDSGADGVGATEDATSTTPVQPQDKKSTEVSGDDDLDSLFEDDSSVLSDKDVTGNADDADDTNAVESSSKSMIAGPDGPGGAEYIRTRVTVGDKTYVSYHRFPDGVDAMSAMGDVDSAQVHLVKELSDHNEELDLMTDEDPWSEARPTRIDNDEYDALLVTCDCGDRVYHKGFCQPLPPKQLDKLASAEEPDAPAKTPTTNVESSPAEKQGASISTEATIESRPNRKRRIQYGIFQRPDDDPDRYPTDSAIRKMRKALDEANRQYEQRWGARHTRQSRPQAKSRAGSAVQHGHTSK
jgi:hypothetical protein